MFKHERFSSVQVGHRNKNKTFQIIFKNVSFCFISFFLYHFFQSHTPRIKKDFPVYILKKGRAGFQYNRAQTEVKSLDEAEDGDNEQCLIFSTKIDNIGKQNFTNCHYW